MSIHAAGVRSVRPAFGDIPEAADRRTFTRFPREFLSGAFIHFLLPFSQSFGAVGPRSQLHPQNRRTHCLVRFPFPICRRRRLDYHRGHFLEQFLMLPLLSAAPSSAKLYRRCFVFARTPESDRISRFSRNLPCSSSSPGAVAVRSFLESCSFRRCLQKKGFCYTLCFRTLPVSKAANQRTRSTLNFLTRGAAGCFLPVQPQLFFLLSSNP